MFLQMFDPVSRRAARSARDPTSLSGILEVFNFGPRTNGKHQMIRANCDSFVVDEL
jgi:hypothetical protein